VFAAGALDRRWLFLQADASMLAHFRPDDYRMSIFWRAIYAVGLVMVFFYISFDVLDLDGSDFRPVRYPMKSVAIVNDTLKEIERSYFPQPMKVCVDPCALWPGGEVNLVPLCHREALSFSVRDSSRNRGYRVALPRSSVSDPFLSA